MKRSLAIALILACAANAKAVTLDAALAKTLEQNPTVIQAKIALEEAAGRRLVLRAVGLPDFRIQILAGDQGGHRAGQSPNQPFGFARGFFTQPLFNAAVPASRRKATVEVLLAQQRLNLAIVGQLHATRVSFYTAQFNDSLRALGEAQHARLTQNVEAQSARYQAGNAGRGAMTSAQLLESELNPRIEQVRRAYDGALLTMAQSMGANLGATPDILKPEGELQFVEVTYDVNAETATALAQRPDLQLARLLVRSSEEDQRIIEAAYYPAVDVIASGNYIPITAVRQANGGSARSSDDILSSEGAGGISYTWRVVDNGKIGGQVGRQRAIKEMNEISLRKLEATVPRELQKIRNNLGAVERRWKSLNAASSAAEENVAVVQRSLDEGLSSQLEFRTAESSYLETKTALLSAAYQQNVARAEWDRATGRYFQFSEDTTENLH